MSKTASGLPYNDYKPVERGNYGVRVARNGFDAETSGDSNLLFNSGWRIIQIVNVISEDNKVVAIDETQNIPSGWVYVDEQNEGLGDWNCAVDEKWLYLPGITYTYMDTADSKYHLLRKQYKIYHGLGYVPLFFKSKYVSDRPGYYLLTNVDIREDADYPYTSKASYYDGNTKNYGIKSISRTRKRMPEAGETRGCGLNTSIQSKLVMAVKTEKSMTSDLLNEQPGTNPTCAWAVPRDNNSQTVTNITDYEPFGFYAGSGSGSGKFMEYPTGQVGGTVAGRYQFIDQAGAAFERTKMSMVILRTPMVAPDLEEFTIS